MLSNSCDLRAFSLYKGCVLHFAHNVVATRCPVAHFVAHSPVSQKVLIGATVASTLWALGTDALGLDPGLRFTGTYLIAGIPIGVVAIGSVAPGILFLPVTERSCLQLFFK